jgi:Flp pilus assembly pilin Flp
VFVPVRSGDESGQGLAEYALILLLIAIALILALAFLGQSIMDFLETAGQELADL